MATITSNATGLWNSPATWVGGIVPGTTFTTTRLTTAAGFAVGATSVAMQAGTAITAGDVVQFDSDPNYYRVTSALSASAGNLILDTGLLVAIPASATTVKIGFVADKVIIAAGHVVTVTGTTYAGDDTQTAVTINGTLKANRTVSNQITFRGECIVGSGGILDYGTQADPIPSAITAAIWVNDSANQSNCKYGISCVSSGNILGVRFWGAGNKTDWSTISAATATDTIFTVADATGWAVGDFLCFAWTSFNNTNTGAVFRAITNMSGGPTNASITVSANLGFASQAGRKVINLTRNVVVKGVNGKTYQAGTSFTLPNSQSSTNVVEVGYCEFALSGGLNFINQQIGGVTFGITSGNGSAIRTIKQNTHVVCHNVWSISGSTVVSSVIGQYSAMLFFGGQSYNHSCTYPIIAHVSSGVTALAFLNGANQTVTNIIVAGVLSLAGSSYSQGGVNSTISGGFAENIYYIFTPSNSVYFNISNISLRGLTAFYANVPAVSFTMTNLDLGNSSPTSTTSQNSTSAYFNITADGCIMDPSWVLNFSTSNMHNALPASFFRIRNKNNDPTLQDCYVKGGKQSRDNTMVYRGISSVALYPWYSGIQNIFTTTIPVALSASVRIKGYYRFNTAYLTNTPPTVTVSGMGITPVVSTCTATADTWFPFDITVTNPQAYPSLFTITFTGQSTGGTAATCWFDGVAIIDYVTWTDHYGFIYDPNNAARTIDPLILLSESAAAALTGISYSGNTLTITGSRSTREIYDFIKQYTASNRLSPIITSTDGVSFALAANLTLGAGAAITGSGTLTIGSNILTVGVGATSTVNITHSAGIWTQIILSGMLSGTTLIVDDITSSVNLYTGTPGTSWNANIQWPSINRSIRIRARYAVGTIAKIPIDTTGTLSSSGLTMLLSQVTDPYYIQDGSIITGITFSGSTNTAVATTTKSLTALYAAAVYWSSLTSNYGYSSPVSTADGNNYISSYAWTIGAIPITGVGAISLGSASLTVNPGATSTVVWTYSGGAGAWVQILLSNIVSGSSVIVDNSSTSTNLYTGTPGTSLAINVVWTTNQTIRVRVRYQNGVVAKIPVDVTSTLTNAGASFTISQINDTVYNTLGVDGATLTGITVSGSGNLITVNSSHSNADLYSYAVYWATSISNFNYNIPFASDGVVYTSSYAISIGISTVITGNFTTSSTVTNAGLVDGVYVSSGGTSTRLSLTGLVSTAVEIFDNTGTHFAYVSSVTGTYILNRPHTSTGTWTWKVAKYGYNAISGTFVAGTGVISAAPVFAADLGITQATVATVSAYTTFANLDQIYDYLAYYETTASGIQTDRLVSKVGSVINFGSQNIVINGTAVSLITIASGTITLKTGALTLGSTFIEFSTSGTFSAINTASYSQIYTDVLGRHVYLIASALISGSRIQLYNVTDGIEIYNNILASTGLTISVIWPSNKIIRLRAEHSSKLPLQAIGVLSSSGSSFLDIQADDTVYSTNGIDGSVVTEFSADGPNVQIDINDPDGVTSVQRLYAWIQYYQTTSVGIASVFFGAITATDTANYMIDQTLVNVQLDNVGITPVRVIGGYLSRKDGSTLIAPTSGSIQMDPGKAYVAPLSALSIPAGEKIFTMQPSGAIIARG